MNAKASLVSPVDLYIDSRRTRPIDMPELNVRVWKRLLDSLGREVSYNSRMKALQEISLVEVVKGISDGYVPIPHSHPQRRAYLAARQVNNSPVINVYVDDKLMEVIKPTEYSGIEEHYLQPADGMVYYGPELSKRLDLRGLSKDTHIIDHTPSSPFVVMKVQGRLRYVVRAIPPFEENEKPRMHDEFYLKLKTLCDRIRSVI